MPVRSIHMPGATEAKRFAERVVRWHAQFGRHDLPWQKRPTPYRVWVSEIMLQQTQVAAVIPYFQRFMQRFPTLTALANAQVDEVMHHWSGLGYYARARNLHKSAQILMHNYNGRFPTDIEKVMALPGIGRSTAGAILALSKQLRHPILDGNVKRVLCRYFAIEGWPDQPSNMQLLWQYAERLTPQAHVQQYTQAMMDLGATVCTRKNPQCGACPLAKHCVARRQALVHALPTPKPKRSLPIKKTRMLLIHDSQKRVLLELRPAHGIWGGLWSLPECESDADISAWCAQRFGIVVAHPKTVTRLRHSFSHFHLDISAISVECLDYHQRVMDMERSKLYWYKASSRRKLGFAAPIKYLLDSFSGELTPP